MGQKEVSEGSGAEETDIENGKNYKTTGESVQTEHSNLIRIEPADLCLDGLNY